MNCKEANELSIIEFLQKNGIEPKYISGDRYWHLSPLRRESHASFIVKKSLNRWWDFGIGKGGKLVDIGPSLLNMTIPDFLSAMSKSNLKPFILDQQEIVNSPTYRVQSVKALHSGHLIDYLTDRSIPKLIATQYCQEIVYTIKDRDYSAICFKNDSQGYEVRSRFFKGCLGQKDITTIRSHESKTIVLYEGFLDFVTGLKLKMSSSDFIVLNSVNQIEKAKFRIREIQPNNIEAYFDNDNAGRTCFESLKKDFPMANDRSDLYKGFKDLNDMEIIKNEAPWKTLNRQSGLSM